MRAPCERVRRGSEAATLARIIHECRREAPPSAFLMKRPSLGIRAYGSYSRRGERMAYGR